MTKLDMIDSVAFILRRGDQVLIEKRSEAKPTDPGKHCVPSGGVEDGESFQDALVREVREEFSAQALSYHEVYETTYHKEDVSFNVQYYLVEAWKGDIEKHEAAELEWRKLSPQSVDIEPDKQALNSL